MTSKATRTPQERAALPPLHVVLELVRAHDVADAHGVALGDWNTYLLRDPDDSGRYAEGELFWDASLTADLSPWTAPAAAASPGALPSAMDTLTRSMHTFLAAAGWKQIEARIAAARAGGRSVQLTVRSAAAELHALPWEFVLVGNEPVCSTDTCLIRYDCSEAPGERAAQAAPPPPSGRILMAWSAAGGAVPAGEHLQAIADAARRGYVPFDPRGDQLGHASLAALAAALAQSTPPVTILHLLCHGRALADGQAFGLMLDGADEPAGPDAIRALLEPYRHTLRLVVLAACHGSNPGAPGNRLGSVAQALQAAGIPAVVASRYPLTVPGSTVITRVLYRDLLVDMRSLEQAFTSARAAVRALGTGCDWAALQPYGSARMGVDHRPWIVCPYRGLMSYELAHERFFAGRDHERAELGERIAGAMATGAPRILMIAGASGTGKSSLVKAGVLADLINGRTAPVAGGWTATIVRPSEDQRAPAELVRRRLADREHQSRAPGSPRPWIALVVDQLEELFTGTASAEARQELVRLLWQLACDSSSQVFVIGTLRIEYLGRLGTVCMDDGVPFDHELLRPERCYLVRQLGPAQYQDIVRQPAETVGLHIEPGLLERLVAALGTEPGALPLVSYTLDLLWQRRSFQSQTMRWSLPGGSQLTETVTGWWLTDAAYDQLGGLEGALAGSADELLARLSPAEQDQVRRVLVQLVHGHDDPMLATRRRGWRDALRPDAQADAPVEATAAQAFDTAIDALIAARLLVQGAANRPGEPTRSGEPDGITSSHAPAGQQSSGPWLELAHDSLVRYWPALRQWYHEARDWLAHTDELRGLALAWHAHAQTAETDADNPYLLRGQRLAYHAEMWGRHRHHLGAGDRSLMQAFVDASLAAEDARRQREQARLEEEIRLRHRAEEAHERAERQLRLATARHAALLAQSSLDAGKPTRALRAAVDAVQATHGAGELVLAEAEEVLRAALAAVGGRPLPGLVAAVLAGRNQLITVTSSAGQTSAWLVDPNNPAVPPRRFAGAVELRSGEDGMELATTLAVRPDGGLVATSRGELWRPEAPEARPVPLPAFPGISDLAIVDIVFSRNGQSVFGFLHDRATGQSHACRWDVTAPDTPRAVEIVPISARMPRRPGVGKRILVLTQPAGILLLCDTERGVAPTLWPTRTPAAEGDLHMAPSTIRGPRTFTPDLRMDTCPAGQRVAFGSGTSLQITVVAGTHQSGLQPFARTSIDGHGDVDAVAFASAELIAAAGQLDPRIVLWRLRQEADSEAALPPFLTGHDPPVVALHAVPEHHILISRDRNGCSRWWNIGRDSGLSGEPRLLRVRGISVSGCMGMTGTTLMRASADLGVMLWALDPTSPTGDLQPSARLAPAPGCPVHRCQPLSVHRRGSGVIVIGIDETSGQSFFLELGGGHERLCWLSVPRPCTALSDDGCWLAIASAHSGDLELWDLTASPPAPALRLPGRHPVGGLTFAPSGRELIIADSEAASWLELPSMRELVRLPWSRARMPVTGLACAPDGRIVAGWQSDILRLQRLGQTALEHGAVRFPVPRGEHVLAAAFVPGGILATVHQRHVRLWRVDIAELVARARAALDTDIQLVPAPAAEPA